LSLAELEKILRAADTEPERTASDGNAIAKVGELLLSPVEAMVEGMTGLAREHLGGVASKRSQNICEYRCAVPERERLVAPLRIALGTRKSTTKDAAYFLGVTVGQAWEETRRGEEISHAAQIRWGLWTHTSKVKDRIAGPFRGLAEAAGRPLVHLPSHPILNSKNFYLSMLGNIVFADGLSKFESLDELIANIAADLAVIVGAMATAPPAPEE
jgi:hypothetical protein